MQQEIPDLDLLYRCARGVCNADERAAVAAWLDDDEQRHALFRAIAAIAREPERLDERFDAVAATRHLRRAMQRATAHAAAVSARGGGALSRLVPLSLQSERPLRGPLRVASRDTARARWSRRRAVAATVAAALGAIGVGLGIWSFARARESARVASTETTTIVAPTGKVEHVRLPDGTRVALAPTSVLTYSSAFGGLARDVRLEGEAHFAVAHDPARRFTVLARHGVAEVVGTVFTVRAYAGEPEVRVVVAEGRVAVGLQRRTAEQGGGREGRRDPQSRSGGSAIEGTSEILGPGDVWRLAPDGAARIERTDVKRYTAWMNGVLVFRGTPLAEVRAELARWLDVRLEFTDPSLASRRLTGSFASTSVAEILAAIGPALQVHYEVRGHRVLLSPIDAGARRRTDARDR